MKAPGIDRVASLIREAAAMLVLPRFEHLAEADIRQKSAGDLVTIADLETEAWLAPRLLDLLPGSTVVGEEGVARDEAALERLAGVDPVWLIDPIDGTSNFASDIPLFAVMVALVRDCEILAAWIHDPVSGRMATAEHGSGAWCDGTRMRVAGEEPPDRMSGAVSLRYGNRQLVRKIAGRSDMVGSVFSFRCAGHEYLALAGGRAHFALYHRLLPWDHAPGMLIHREAGGFGQRLDRSRYTPLTHDGGLLLAPDEASWNALHAVLIGEDDQAPD